MVEFEPIPDFLRISAEERAAAWKGRRLTTIGKLNERYDWHLPQSIDAAGRALFKEQERAKAQRAKERLAALRQRRERT